MQERDKLAYIFIRKEGEAWTVIYFTHIFRVLISCHLHSLSSYLWQDHFVYVSLSKIQKVCKYPISKFVKRLFCWKNSMVRCHQKKTYVSHAAYIYSTWTIEFIWYDDTSAIFKYFINIRLISYSRLKT